MECPLICSLFETVRLMREEERSVRDYGVDTPLYHSEVRLLEAIYSNPEQRAGTLSETLSITKGALAQAAKKLMDKGLIEQYNAQGNRKTKYYRLTELGEVARIGHIRYHDQSIERMRTYLCHRSEDEKRMLMDFLKEVGQCMPLCAYDCTSPESQCVAITKETGDQGGKCHVGT